jgi:putative phage-type endonuclease
MSVEYREVYSAQRTPAWHAFRHGRLTASVAAAALGLSPWASPKKAYRQVLGLEPHVSTWYMEHGREMEPIVRGLYAQQTGLDVTETGFWERSDCPWLGASPDAMVDDNGVLEIKVSKLLHSRLPEEWRIQAVVQLLCTGRQWAQVAHYHFGRLHVYDVPADDRGDIMYRLKCWYEEFPKRGVEPPRRRRGVACK